MRTIALTQGYEAIVDDEDYESLSMHRWQAAVSFSSHRKFVYAIRTERIDGKRRTVRMHRQIAMATNPIDIVDHCDGNGLNNQRSNIRICACQQNNQNAATIKPWKNTGNSSRYKGVRRDSRWNTRFEARIKCNGKLIHIGNFTNEDDAAKAYDEAARKYFGEFARTNFGPSPT